MRTLYLIRGLPGCGKTSLADKLTTPMHTKTWDPEEDGTVAADDFFVGEDGVYRFDPRFVPQAHAWCRQRVDDLLNWTGSNSDFFGSVVVHNTFTQRWELEPYFRLANAHGSRVVVIDLFDGGCSDEELFDRNGHGVPLDTIQQMRDGYEHDWRSGNPTPPWERN